MRTLRMTTAACIASMVALAACSKSSTGPTSDMTTYGGQASAAVVTLPAGSSSSLAATGQLPSAGGALNASLDADSIPGLLGAQSLQSSIVGQGSSSSSSASVTNVTILVGTHTIIAMFVGTETQAVCSNHTPQLSGSTNVEGLVVDGTPVAVTGDADQTVALTGGGQLIINQQIVSSNAITVNGLHVTMTGGLDVIVAQSMASISCGTTCPTAQGDFVTGGGWVAVSGGKATFGFEAGRVGSNAPTGEIEFNDHVSGLRIHASAITGYTVVNATTRKITGNTTVNGAAATFTLTVTDNGEPGRNDTFDFMLSTGYDASGTLGGGNIQVHTREQDCQ